MLPALCLAMFSFLACSPKEAHRPDRGNQPEPTTPVVDGCLSPRADPGRGSVAGTGGRVAIDRAVLSSAGEADHVHVRVEYGGSWVWPRCSLLEGPAVETVLGTIGRGEPPRAEGFTRGLWVESLWTEHESQWADRSTIEKFIEDDGSVLWIFREDPSPEGGAGDPRQTPFYVRCAGGERPEIVLDVAHVSGTPGAISEPTPSPRGNP